MKEGIIESIIPLHNF